MPTGAHVLIVGTSDDRDRQLRQERQEDRETDRARRGRGNTSMASQEACFRLPNEEDRFEDLFRIYGTKFFLWIRIDGIPCLDAEMHQKETKKNKNQS